MSTKIELRGVTFTTASTAEEERELQELGWRFVAWKGKHMLMQWFGEGEPANAKAVSK